MSGKDDAAINRNLAEQVHRVLATLTPREEEILRARFGPYDHTLEDVGQDFEVTRARILQIEANALERLRHSSSGNRRSESAAEPSRSPSGFAGASLRRQ